MPKTVQTSDYTARPGEVNVTIGRPMRTQREMIAYDSSITVIKSS